MISQPALKAVLNQTLEFQWFGNKKITIEAHTPITVRRMQMGLVTNTRTFETDFDDSEIWCGSHNGISFELQSHQFTIVE